MTAALALLCRVVRRRVNKGESLDSVLKDYPKLTEEAWGITYSKNEAEYLEHIHTLQKMAADDLFAFALCWEQCFFPYRTDKYQGFENIDSVGVVHAETFYTLTAK